MKEALKKAGHFIKFRPRSSGEVREKLKSQGFSQVIIRKTLEYLMETEIINDESFAKAWVSERANSKFFGKSKIKSELSRKGIAPDIMEKALNDVFQDLDEGDQVLQFLNNKFKKGYRNLDKRKLMALLLRNGFSYSQAEKALKFSEDETDENE